MTEDPAVRQRLEAFLAALDRLPPAPAVTFRGLRPEDAVPRQSVVTQLLTATSRVLPVATDSWRTHRLTAVLGVTGRDIAALSAQTDSAEIVYRPATLFVAHEALIVEGVEVGILEEIPVVDGALTASGYDIAVARTRIADYVAREAGVAAFGEVRDGDWSRFVGPIE